MYTMYTYIHIYIFICVCIYLYIHNINTFTHTKYEYIPLTNKETSVDTMASNYHTNTIWLGEGSKKVNIQLLFITAVLEWRMPVGRVNTIAFNYHINTIQYHNLKLMPAELKFINKKQINIAFSIRERNTQH
jgi:hypothetical protein